jgi:hypothetical protein
METPAIYGSDQTPIRSECLRPFDEGWEQPTPAEVRRILKAASLTGAEAARLLGISDGRTIRRWTGGDAPIPYAAWAILVAQAKMGFIWEKTRAYTERETLRLLRSIAESEPEKSRAVLFDDSSFIHRRALDRDLVVGAWHQHVTRYDVPAEYLKLTPEGVDLLRRNSRDLENLED